MNRHVLAPALLLALTASASPAFELQAEPDRLASPHIGEASGLAVSPTEADFLWIINDSGGTPKVHLADMDGSARGAVKVKGVKNIDWEDLASFAWEGKPHLLIADTGDNKAVRETSLIHIIREPALPAEGNSLEGKVPVAWQIEFSFEGGPRDCEAVAVDAQAGKIILVSKRTEPAEIFELPLKPSAKEKPLVAKKIGTTEARAPTISLPIPFRHQPTGMDISADSSMATIITYYGAFLFPREPQESWAEALARPPINLGSHRLHQAESVAFSRDGATIFAVSEGLNSPIMRYEKARR